MKRIKHILFFILLQILFVSFNNAVAQTWQTEGFEGGAMPPAGWFNVPGLPINGSPLEWQNVQTVGTSPVHSPHGGTRQAEFNSGILSASNSSWAIRTPVIDYSGGRCGTEVVSFWMYRDGAASGNVDRLDVWINTATNFTGATLLGSINRRKSLFPVETGADGWYNYSFAIPATYNGNTNYILFEGNNNNGTTSNLYIDDVSWNIFPFGGGVLSNAGIDAAVCSGNSVSLGAAAIAGCTYAWAPTTGLSNSNIANPTLLLYNNTTLPVITEYTVTTTKTGACAGTSTDVVAISVTPGPTVTVVPSSTNICSGGTVPLTTNATTLVPLTTFTNNTSVLIPDFGTAISVMNVSGFSGTVGALLQQVNIDLNHTWDGDLNISLKCPSGTVINLSSGNGGGGDNYTNTTFSTIGAPITSGTPPFTGTFTPQQPLINLNGCPVNGTWTLQVQDVSAPDLGIINSWSLGFTSGAISTYNWLPASGLSSTTVSNPSATPASSTIYTVTVADSHGCANTATSSINLNPQPTITISSTGISCFGMNGNITASGTNISTYLWSNGATSSMINVPAGLYTCTVTSAAGCTATASYNLIQPTPLFANSTGPITICGGATSNVFLFASGGSGPYTFNWYAFPNANITGESTAPQVGSTINDILVNTSGSNQTVNYTYQVTDSYGCTVTNATNINVTAAYTYTANVVDQPILTNVGRCATKQEILRLKMDISNGTCPSTPTVTNIIFTAASTQAEVTRAYIYYTGSNPNFTPTNLFATINTLTGGSMNIVGSQTLTAGSNYFWLAYDINPLGVGPVVDATFIDFILSGGSNPASYTAVSGNPPGSRAITTCISPGGIYTGLTYWLKSTDGSNLNSTTHNTPINNWSSSFSNISDLTQATAAKQPTFQDYPHDTTFNFNPYLSFDGSDDILQNTTITDLLANDGLAMLICAKSTTVAPNNNTSLGFQKSAGNIAYQINPEATLRYRNSSGTSSSFNVTGFTLPDADFIMAKMLSIAGNSSGTPGIADFMRNDNVFQGSGATPPVVETGFTIGGSGDGGSFNRGNSRIAEVITYNRYLPQVDLDKVETYAAIKYGIHLDKDYKSSAGTTIWNYAANTTYNHDICGIGRDDNSGLNQKQTQSVNIDEMLTIGLDSIEDSNKNNTAAFDNDNSFLVWGNNNQPPYSDFSTIIPIAFPFLPPGIQGRIKRVWKLQGTNFGTSGTFNKSANPQDNEQNGTMATTSTTTTIEVAFDDYLLFNTNPVANLRLLVDDDGVDFSNAVVKGPGKIKGGATQSGGRVSFEGIVIKPGNNYVTLATTNIAGTLLPLELINFKAICENNVAHVSWSTAAEHNVKDFAIEQSTDGVNYTTAKIISPKGNTNSVTNYSARCSIIPSKINYFRLKETSNHNIIYNFAPVSISDDCSDSNNTQAFISPNPVSGNNGELTIRFNNEINSLSDLKIMNNLGNTIYQTDYKSSETYNSLKLQVNNLGIGIYFLEIKNNRGSYRFKFIVVE